MKVAMVRTDRFGIVQPSRDICPDHAAYREVVVQGLANVLQRDSVEELHRHVHPAVVEVAGVIHRYDVIALDGCELAGFTERLLRVIDGASTIETRRPNLYGHGTVECVIGTTKDESIGAATKQAVKVDVADSDRLTADRGNPFG